VGASGVEEAVRKSLTEAPFALKQLSEQSGISYDVVRSWKSGRRRPSREGARRLAAGLEEKAGELLALAQAVRRSLDNGIRPGAGERARPAAGAASATAGARSRQRAD
jgi:transcriptional regulator with XRE-family HTH domain